MRIVPAADWDLSRLSDNDRRQRLLFEIAPTELVEQLAAAGRQAFQSHEVELEWQLATDATAPADTFRVVTQIPVTVVFFDQLFNGRCGYRAQYYLSSEEGEAFNRLIVEALEPIVCDAIAKDSGVSRSHISKSVLGPYSKISAFEEQTAFNDAEPGMLRLPRWVANGYGLGRGTRLPLASRIDVKGTFLQPNGSYWVDELKLDRPIELHTKGFT